MDLNFVPDPKNTYQYKSPLKENSMQRIYAYPQKALQNTLSQLCNIA